VVTEVVVATVSARKVRGWGAAPELVAEKWLSSSGQFAIDFADLPGRVSCRVVSIRAMASGRKAVRASRRILLQGGTVASTFAFS
jgi:hypothetical protein